MDGDTAVSAADLAIVLGAWGPAAASDPADIDHSGQVDATDLALVLGGWGACPTPCLKTLVVGTVALKDGTPVSEAVVVTELGGKGVSAPDGSFGFEVEVGQQANSLNVTAIASIRGVTYTGTKLVSPIVLDGDTDAGTIVVSSETGCSGEFGWLPGFGLRGMNAEVQALTVFDDGSGPALYAGGFFTTAGGAAANRIAKWDGISWSPIGTDPVNGMDGGVYALSVFDDGLGGGPALYAGGSFTTAGGVPANRIAKWDGSSWSPLGSGVSGGITTLVRALKVFDDGSGGGPALYAGGFFTTAGGVPANNIAKWDGMAWSSLGEGEANGVNVSVLALSVFDDGLGGGPALYAGGSFTTAGGVPANRIAKWDGSSWSPLVTGSANGVNDWVEALEVFDDGSGVGPALFAAGHFTTAGTLFVGRIAKWDGNNWWPVGTGLNQFVKALTIFDDGSGGGPALYVGGNFTTAGGVPANYIAKWNGTLWSSLGTGTTNGVSNLVFALMPFGGGRAPALYVGGFSTKAGGETANYIAKWDGTAWSPLGTSAANGMNHEVHALAVFDDGEGGGPALYAGGTFTMAGGVTANGIAKWDGTSWWSVGPAPWYGVNSSGVFALAVFDDGSGPGLYAAGGFSVAGGVSAKKIAKWNGISWSSLGTGSANGVNGTISALTVFDDGSGPALYAGGFFTTAGGVTANSIARWNGTSWSSVGTGSANGVNGSVDALAVFDDGSGGGPALYAGGFFTTAGGVPANYIAKWDGMAWSSLGEGEANGVNVPVFALSVFDDGGGPALYAGGGFTTAGGIPAYNIARWNGSSWAPLLSNSANGVNNIVSALSVFDDGGGPALYAGGYFETAGGVPASRIARWDGTSWSPLGAGVTSGMDGAVYALTVFDDGAVGGQALFAGGQFATAGGLAAARIAKWGCVISGNDAPDRPHPAVAMRSPRVSLEHLDYDRLLDLLITSDEGPRCRALSGGAVEVLR